MKTFLILIMIFICIFFNIGNTLAVEHDYYTNIQTKHEAKKSVIILGNKLDQYSNGKNYKKAIDSYIDNSSEIKLEILKVKVKNFLNNSMGEKTRNILKYLLSKIELELLVKQNTFIYTDNTLGFSLELPKIFENTKIQLNDSDWLEDSKELSFNYKDKQWPQDDFSPFTILFINENVWKEISKPVSGGQNYFSENSVIKRLNGYVITWRGNQDSPDSVINYLQPMRDLGYVQEMDNCTGPDGSTCKVTLIKEYIQDHLKLIPNKN